MADSVRHEIERQVREFEGAFNRGDLAALAALYTEDATLLPPDSGTITGRAEIQRFWQGVRDSGARQAALRTQHVEGNGDMAAEVGAADLTVEAEGGQSSTVPVKYVVVWKRQAGGRWQLAVDIWNSRPST